MSLSILNNLFIDESSKDVTLKVKDDDRTIKAHRLLLCGASNYFKLLLNGDFAEKDAKEITLEGLSFEVLSMLVTFMYTNELSITEKCTLKQSFLAADYLMMDCALEKLNKHALGNMSEKDAFEIFTIEGKVSDALLQNALDTIVARINQHMSEIVQLTVVQVLRLINYMPDQTKNLMCVIVNWVKAAAGREEHLFELLSATKFDSRVGVR